METEQETKKSLLTRIREFQYDMEDIEILRTTAGYGYEYTDLPTILKIINPLLKKHGIWYKHSTTFNIDLKCNLLYSTIYNTDNESEIVYCHSIIDNEATLGGMNRFQVEGSAITYFRRYHIVTLLGLTTEEDSDAAGKRKSKSKNQSNENKEQSSSTQTTSETLDFVKFFTEMIEKKRPVKKIEGVLTMYKEQINNEDLKTISNLIKDYENK